MMITGNPFAGSALSLFVAKRILELRPKSQREIGLEAGFTNVNMISLLKSGRTKLPLDRVPALAKALECDPKRLFRLALQQGGNETMKNAVEQIFGTIVSQNEVAWLEEIRDASDHHDPRLTNRARTTIRGIFRK
jgi:transcriptional regulator with XRE-family HTH domain